MAACDVVVSLRAPTMGETSGSAIRALSLGRPLVVSDLGWFAELPDDGRAEGRARRARGRRARRRARAAARRRRRARAMSAAARDAGREEHDLDRVADLYAAALEEAAGGERVADAVPREVARGRGRGRHRAGRSRGDGARRPACARSSSAPRSARCVLAARPGLGLARGHRRRLGARPLRARPRHGRAVDHGRRAHLLRAREELRRHGPLPHPRRGHGRVRRRLPAADRARLGALRRRCPTRTRRRRRSTRS